MRTAVHFLPLATTVLAAFFAWVVARRYLRKGYPPHLGWWTAGIALYGLGTAAESAVTLFGWSEVAFRTWYVAGALLGGAPLAQGTVYLLMRHERANLLSLGLMTYLAVAIGVVLAAPLDLSAVEPHRLSGSVFADANVRLFSPLINIYALIFLVGGAAVSAWRFRRAQATRHRMWGNVLIAVGALLPGIGGSFTRAGFVEVLYVTELVGLVMIFLGFVANTKDRPVAPPAEGAVLDASASR